MLEVMVRGAQKMLHWTKQEVHANYSLAAVAILSLGAAACNVNVEKPDPRRDTGTASNGRDTGYGVHDSGYDGARDSGSHGGDNNPLREDAGRDATYDAGDTGFGGDDPFDGSRDAGSDSGPDGSRDAGSDSGPDGSPDSGDWPHAAADGQYDANGADADEPFGGDEPELGNDGSDRSVPDASCTPYLAALDDDHDGYWLGGTEADFCAPLPENFIYVNASNQNKTDCDDADSTVQVQYNEALGLDRDSDTFFEDVFTGLCLSKTLPSQYKSNPDTSRPFDCNDRNSAIHPAATEGCNGEDDDCKDGIDRENNGALLERIIYGCSLDDARSRRVDQCTAPDEWTTIIACYNPDQCNTSADPRMDKEEQCGTDVGQCSYGTETFSCTLNPTEDAWTWVSNVDCTAVLPITNEDLNGDGQPQPAEANGFDDDCDEITDNGVLVVSVPAGQYTQGCVGGETQPCNGDDPVRQITLSSYKIDVFEVTVGQYKQCVAAGECSPPANLTSFTRSDYHSSGAYDTFPVIHVTQTQAAEYCAWAGKRLPTEAEWEIAARGSDARMYPWGNENPDDSRANYNTNVGDTAEVGSYPAGISAFGALDMAGNVMEWTADWYGSYGTAGQPIDNPTGPAEGSEKAIRGGRWSSSDPNQLTTYGRLIKQVPTAKFSSLGFRCVKDTD